MGKSRSAACVIAYLMQRYKITPRKALSQIQETRAICEPNDGFMRQLELYYQMQCPLNVKEHPMYQRWLYQRDVEISVACGLAPKPIRFEDQEAAGPSVAGSTDSELELRCRKCR